MSLPSSSKSSFISPVGCNKNHWQNSVEPNQPTKGEFVLFIQMECFLCMCNEDMCIMSSLSTNETHATASNTVRLHKQQPGIENVDELATLM